VLFLVNLYYILDNFMSIFLVTGGAGFIGSNLADELIARGHRVRIIDNLSTGKRENIPTKAEFFEVDFTELESIRQAFVGVDGVFHTGAMPRIPFSIEFPNEAAQINIMGTLHVFLAAKDAKVKRVVFSASASVYGAQSELPLKLNMPPDPLNPYALHKYVGEKIAGQFFQFFGLEAVSLRYFNVYGPRMAEEGAYLNAIAAFIKQRKNGDPITIYGDGNQTRDFIHVDDVVRANLLAMESSRVGQGEVFNIGSGERYSMNEIARIVGGDVKYFEARKGEARHTLADISITKEILCWEPAIPFSEGLRDLILLHGLKPNI
jgi:UDP-glucose 4-epimerase